MRVGNTVRHAHRATGGAIACTVGVLAIALAAGTSSPAQEEPFRGEIEVTRIVTQIRVIRHDGTPVPDLGRDAFRVTVDGDPVEVESAEWVAEAMTPALAETGHPPPSPTAPEEVVAPPPRGRLIVLLFQTDFHRSRITGLLRIDGHAIDFVRGLAPSDRVAVAVMGSHLQLHADFTDDLEGVCEELSAPEVLKWRTASDDGRWPSLARNFDQHRARRATNISEALGVLGDALAPIPGTKAIVLLGWGAGQFRARSGVVQLGADYEDALEALARARTSVFSLDITSADFHSLQVGLERLAEDTGGFYVKTHLFPEIAVAKLARTLTGHYEVTLLPPREGLEESFKVKVAVDLPGVEVMVRRIQFSKPPA